MDNTQKTIGDSTMPESTQQGGQTGDRYITNNSSYRPSWRDNSIIITMVLNLIFLIGVIFGGLKWITEVNTTLAIVQSRQEIVLKTIKDIQDFDVEVAKRHAVEDALYPDAMKILKNQRK